MGTLATLATERTLGTWETMATLETMATQGTSATRPRPQGPHGPQSPRSLQSPRSPPGPPPAPPAAAVIHPHGGYHKLLTYQKSDIIYQETVLFTQRFLSRGDRTVDQMVQAARSGKQNIVEGSEASATSKETELKLTNVAKASLEELLEDYLDYLKAHGFEVWEKDSEKGRAARELGKTADSAAWDRLFREKPDETVANLQVSLIRQCTYLLSRQIAQLENDFKNHGGIRERMHAARTATRATNWEAALADWLGAADSAEELSRRVAAAHDAARRIEWRELHKKGWA